SASLSHRAGLCAILQRQNRSWGNRNTDQLIQKLERPDTYCVVTGQQAGLLTGPLYTIWKALTALHLSSKWDQQGLRCVPVFWIASEDHNLREVSRFALLNEELELSEFSLRDHFIQKRQPSGAIPVDHPEIRDILTRCFQEIRNPAVKEYYSSGTLAEAFAKTLVDLFKELPILVVDPADPELKRLGKPFFTRFFERSERLVDLLAQQNAVLTELNYPVQVKPEDNVMPIFMIRNGEREHILKDCDPTNMAPEDLSPAALLRPLFQDYLLPTLAYIGGPGEVAYFAQLHPWYEAMEITQPWLFPRASLTLIPPQINQFLTTRNLEPEELFAREDVLFDILAENEDLNAVKEGVAPKKTSVYNAPRGQKLSATLAKPGRKESPILDQIRKAKNVVFPGGQPQERLLNIFSFETRLPRLLDTVLKNIGDLSSHLWIRLS
ncbi:MAG TPA: bacillithiol biosynthesis cysteine-adding enzyme BshC, partial [Acidobacteriota bacterium]|nr:bacillithiol biosynthesis cysteine-adding enzyme BshC [Acidobacteriota bacterium]